MNHEPDPQQILAPILSTLKSEQEQENVRVRAEAEQQAHTLISNNLGKLTPEQFRELFRYINTCVGGKGVVVYVRFAPAFLGHNANLLIERASELNQWIQKLWTASSEDIPTYLDEFWAQKFTGGGRSFPTAILYLRDKERYAVWTRNLEEALYSLTGGVPSKVRAGVRYLEFCEQMQQLRKVTGFPPELHDYVLFKVITSKVVDDKEILGDFAGFQDETFRFMAELSTNNNQTWFQQNEDRFRKSVDHPLRDLIKDLGNEVMTSLDPGLETAPKATKCISRIRKNLYGQQEDGIYHDSYWAAFYRKERTKQTDCQFFVSITSNALHYGIAFVADDVRESLVTAMENHRILAENVFRLLQSKNFLYGHPDVVDLQSFDEFLDLARDHDFQMFRSLTPDATEKSGARLKKEIGDAFRTLYPLFLLATSPDPANDVTPFINVPDDENDGDVERITIADLAASTYMEEAFFTKLDQYLKDKQQLIFAGPPGTGKTFVALAYAKYLAQDDGEVQTVQFHPSYGYEDFMEGLRPVTRDGLLTYDVEDGIFKRLCDSARKNPSGRFVLLVDEINRGNLPRILGELLFLLERREETTLLPYSKKAFSIPRNVIILGTMNSSDRSVSLMDLALRRRFHFIGMEPRGEVLLAWIQEKKKPLGVKDLFDRLNDALRSEGIDEDRLFGHSHFMSSHLDDEFLELIWEGTIMPTLREYFFTEPEKLKKFQFDVFEPNVAISPAADCESTITEGTEEP